MPPLPDSNHPPLTIRNLTSRPLALLQYESVTRPPSPPPTAPNGVLATFTSCLTSRRHDGRPRATTTATTTTTSSTTTNSTDQRRRRQRQQQQQQRQQPSPPDPVYSSESDSDSDPDAARLLPMRPASPFSRTTLSVVIPPFTSREIGLPIPRPPPLDRDEPLVRLTFEISPTSSTSSTSSEPSALYRYQLLLPLSDSRSTPLRPVDRHAPVHEWRGEEHLTAIYHAQPALLAIMSVAPPRRWMASLPSHLPLPALSIPGTHNSPTCYVAFPSVRCQAVSVRAQLDNGVRFLDVRVSVRREHSIAPALHPHDLQLVHAIWPIALLGWHYLGGLLDDLYAFLDANPTETVILSLKREGLGWGTDADLSRRMKEIICTSRPERWYTGTKIPTLGESRGRIVLLRRFALHELGPPDEGSTQLVGWGTSGDGWPDNAEDGLLREGHIRIQDFYEVLERDLMEKKIRLCFAHLERAAQQRFTSVPDEKPQPLFINFLSGSNFFNPVCWPEKIAARMNPAVVEYLCATHGEAGAGPNGLVVGDGATGVVVADWVGLNGDWDLVCCIIAMNARLLLGEEFR